MAHMKSKFCTR